MKTPKLKYSLTALLFLVLASAITMALYRHYYVPPLDQIAGLRIVDSKKNRHDVVFDKDATRQTAAHLIAQLEKNSSLWFYDGQYDSPSDPGAFAEVMFCDGEYVVEFANHGWSSDWTVVSRNEVIDYLWECRRYNGPDRSESLLDEGMWLRKEVGAPTKLNRDREYHVAKYVRSRIGS